jgi:hypothetical protein
MWYYRLYVGNPVAAGYGLYVGGGAVLVAAVLSVFAMVAAWSGMGHRRSSTSAPRSGPAH